MKTTAANNNLYFTSKIATKKKRLVIIQGLYETLCSNVFHLSSTPFTAFWEGTDEVLRISPRCDVTRGENQICPAEDTYIMLTHLFKVTFNDTQPTNQLTGMPCTVYISHSVLKHASRPVLPSWQRSFLQIRQSINGKEENRNGM